MINAKPHGCFLGIIQCHAYHHAKTLVLHSIGLGAFLKNLVHIALVEAEPNPRETLWDTL